MNAFGGALLQPRLKQSDGCSGDSAIADEMDGDPGVNWGLSPHWSALNGSAEVLSHPWDAAFVMVFLVVTATLRSRRHEFRLSSGCHKRMKQNIAKHPSFLFRRNIGNS